MGLRVLPYSAAAASLVLVLLLSSKQSGLITDKSGFGLGGILSRNSLNEGPPKPSALARRAPSMLARRILSTSPFTRFTCATDSDGNAVIAARRTSANFSETEQEQKSTLPLGAGGRGANTTLSSWGLGPRGHAVVFPRQSMVARQCSAAQAQWYGRGLSHSKAE
eukprot:5235576-Pyramimonas_sp.AAC.1